MLKRFRDSGYLKTSILSLAIILLSVLAVAVLDWRDSAAKTPPAETTGQMEGIENRGEEADGQVEGTNRGTFTTGDGERTLPEGMQVTVNPDGSFSITQGEDVPPADGEAPTDGEVPADGEVPTGGETPGERSFPAGGFPAEGGTRRQPGGGESNRTPPSEPTETQGG